MLDQIKKAGHFKQMGYLFSARLPMVTGLGGFQTTIGIRASVD
jgi:hypothetical protein